MRLQQQWKSLREKNCYRGIIGLKIRKFLIFRCDEDRGIEKNENITGNKDQ